MTEASYGIDRRAEGPRAQVQPHAQGCAQAREVAMRAAVAQSAESAQVRSAVERLARLLETGAPLRTDVPRGSYLNIRV